MKAARRETIRVGDHAPSFRLPALDGPEQSLVDLLRQGPVLVAFFKISCPTCQLTFPYLSRLSAGGVRFAGISQDDAASTRAFQKRFGVNFTLLLDEAGGYPASNAYGITHVPAMFLVEPDGAVAAAWAGFSKADMDKLAARLRLPLFAAGDNAPQWKPG